MSDFEKKIENFHLKFYGKIKSEKFMEDLHQKIHSNKVNKYSKLLIFFLIFSFSLFKINDSNNLKISENYSESNTNYEKILETFQDSIFMENLYVLELEETLIAMGDIWSILEFLDEIKIEEEYHYENYN